MLNHPWVDARAEATAALIEREFSSVELAVEHLHRVYFGRSATKIELTTCVEPPRVRRTFRLVERQNESYRPLASNDQPPEGRVKSLSPWESRPERPERVCITLLVFNLPLALGEKQWKVVQRWARRISRKALASG